MTDAKKTIKPILIFGYGNPSRGDDALGPVFLERLAGWLGKNHGSSGLAEHIEYLTDYQLQIEHALDLVGRQLVVFVDAAQSGPAPFHLYPLTPDATLSYTTHAMSPSAILAVYQKTQPAPLPDCLMLAIRGYFFDELGADLSPEAEINLDAALMALVHRLLQSF